MAIKMESELTLTLTPTQITNQTFAMMTFVMEGRWTSVQRPTSVIFE